jgi:hypothetical protein
MEKFLEVVFPVQSIPKLYNKDKLDKLLVRQSPASKDVRREAEEHLLLGATT